MWLTLLQGMLWQLSPPAHQFCAEEMFQQSFASSFCCTHAYRAFYPSGFAPGWPLLITQLSPFFGDRSCLLNCKNVHKSWPARQHKAQFRWRCTYNRTAIRHPRMHRPSHWNIYYIQFIIATINIRRNLHETTWNACVLLCMDIA